MKLRQAAALAAKIANPGRRYGGFDSYVLLKPAEGGITLQARSLDSMLELDVEGPEISEPVLLPAAAFARMIAYMPGAELSVKHHTLTLETEHALITQAGQSPKDVKLTTPPEMDPAETSEIPFNRADFDWCSRNASPDDSRPVLTGVAIDRTTGAMAASDGFRLRMAGEGSEPSEMAVLVAAALPYIPDVDHVRASKTHALFEAPGVRYWTHLIMGTFPDFRKLTPAAADLKWRIDIDTLFLRPAVYGPLSLIGRDGSGIMRITNADAAGKIRISTSAEEVGEARFDLPADITGDPVQIALNIGYFREVLAGSPKAERLTIQGISASAQLLITTDNENRREVVMPMFVQW